MRVVFDGELQHPARLLDEQVDLERKSSDEGAQCTFATAEVIMIAGEILQMDGIC